MFLRGFGVGAMALLWLTLGWGGLTTLETLASPPLEQIGIAACPQGLSISPASPQLMPGQTVQFEGKMTGTGGSGTITFTWNFGDNSPVVTATPKINHTFNSPGLFTVILTGTGDSCGGTTPVVTTLATVAGVVYYLPVILKDFADPIFPTGSALLNTAPLLPTQVTGLTGRTDPASSRTRLEWLPSLPEPITGYRVYRRGPAGEVVFTLPATQTTFTDNIAACGHSYYVTAFNEAGESAASRGSYYGLGCPMR